MYVYVHVAIPRDMSADGVSLGMSLGLGAVIVRPPRVASLSWRNERHGHLAGEARLCHFSWPICPLYCFVGTQVAFSSPGCQQGQNYCIQHPAPEVSNICISQDADSAPLELEVVIGSGKDLYSHSDMARPGGSSPQPDHSHEVMRAACLDPPVRRTCAGSC